jgi:hypothetical protein
MIVAGLSLAISLSGVSYAATTLPRNSVGPAQLQFGAVTAPKLRPGAVTTTTVRDRSLRAVDFARGQLPVGPPGAQGPQGSQGPKGDPGAPADTSRLLGRTVTVVAADSVPAGATDTEVVSCPTGYEAVGGGVDPDDGTTYVVSSSPLYAGGTHVDDLEEGQHGAAIGWFGRVFNSAGSADGFKVAVICARTGGG